MENILNKIELKKQVLDKHSFCQWISGASTKDELLAFAPAMSYFVLGFRDILELVRFANPKSPLEKAINHHCAEDSEHWRWFLKDLEELGYLRISTKEFLGKIWADEQRTPRQMIYFLTHKVQMLHDPALILVVIECLEAAFAVFIERLRPQLVQRGLYNRLSYFGMLHDEDEQSHAMGSWIEGDVVQSATEHFDLTSLVLSDRQYVEATILVDSIFTQFDRLFSHWYQEALSSKTVNVLPLNSFSGDVTLLET